jgi:hypothetical protein
MHPSTYLVQSLLLLLPTVSAQYTLEDDYSPSSFASQFNFFTVSIRTRDRRIKFHTHRFRVTTQLTDMSTTFQKVPVKPQASSAPMATLCDSAWIPRTWPVVGDETV